MGNCYGACLLRVPVAERTAAYGRRLLSCATASHPPLHTHYSCRWVWTASCWSRCRLQSWPWNRRLRRPASLPGTSCSRRSGGRLRRWWSTSSAASSSWARPSERRREPGRNMPAAAGWAGGGGGCKRQWQGDRSWKGLPLPCTCFLVQSPGGLRLTASLPAPPPWRRCCWRRCSRRCCATLAAAACLCRASAAQCSTRPPPRAT